MPFLSLVLLNQSQSVNIGTFHAYGGWSPAYEFGARALRGYADRLHGRIAVSAAARHFIDRYFPGDYKVIPNGVDIDAVPGCRAPDALAGRHPEHPVRRAVRAPQGRAGPAQGLPDPAPDRLRLPAPARGRGPQEREARRYVATRRLQGVEFLGRVSDDERNQLFRTADVFCSPATGRESFGIVLLEAMAAGAPDRRAPTSTATRAWSGAGARRCSSRPRTTRSWPWRSPGSSRDRELAASMSASGLVRAEEFSWPRVTAKVDDYYGFAIRRLAATGTLPAHFTRADPAVATGRDWRGLILAIPTPGSAWSGPARGACSPTAPVP